LAESSGKTLCALKAIAECQKEGGIAAFVDMEHTFSPEFSAKLGVNTEELIVSQPDHAKDAFNVIDALIDSNSVDLIVLDSVAALVTEEELEGEIGKTTVALLARHMSTFLKRIIPKCSKAMNGKGTSVIFINQVRDAIGVEFFKVA